MRYALPLSVAFCLSPLLPMRSFADKVAGSVVTSREWEVKRVPGHEEEVFSGDVHYHAGANDVRADWALYKHGTQQWRARGNVKVQHALDSGDVMHGSGDEAFFNQKNDDGSLEGKAGVSLEREVPGEEPDFAHAGRLSWQGQEWATMTGGVHEWGPRIAAWADRGDYDGKTSLLTLTGGRPVLQKFIGAGTDWVGAVKGDTITASRLDNRLSAQGRVVGWLVFKGAAPAPKVKRKE